MSTDLGASTILPRPRLERTLDESLSRRLTCIVAGAGFGKTKLLESWARSTRCAWHNLTSRDRAASVLSGDILDALSERVPGLPADLAGAIRGTGGADAEDSGRAGVMAEMVCDALHGRLDDDVVLILDDAQNLEPGTAAAQVIEGLCRQAPPTLHVVLCGQGEPPFRIDRLRGYGEVLDVTADDLVFTEQETAELLSAAISGDASEVRQLSRMLWAATGGWPVAVRLAVERLREAPPGDRERIVDGVRLAEGQLFDYLAREVFDDEPFTVRELVRTTAACGQISHGLCEALGQPEAAGHIDPLVRRGLLVQIPRPRTPGNGHRASGNDGSPRYSLIPLAREFALRHYPVDEWELAEVRIRAADRFAADGDVEAALETLLSVDAPDRVVELLAEHGVELLRGGSVDAVIRAAESVPPDKLGGAHWRLLGEALQVRGDGDRALACFARAEAATGSLDSGLAWRMGVIHYLRGDLDEALSLYQRGMATVGRDQDLQAEDAMLLAWTATVYWSKGDASACRELVDRAMRLATESNDDQALAAVHTIVAMLADLEGDRVANDTHSRLALEHAERAGDMLQVIRIRVNRASQCTIEGSYLAALAELEQAIPLADLAGFVAFQALGLHNRADTLTHLGKLDEAVADFEASKRLYQRIGSTNMCNPVRGLGDVYRLRGELALARAAYEEAIRLAEVGPYLQSLVPALSGLARVLAADEPDTAGQLAERAMSYGTGFDHPESLLVGSRVAQVAGDASTAKTLALKAASEARKQRDRAALAEAMEIQAQLTTSSGRADRLLEEAAGIWRELRDPIGTMRVSLLVAERLGEPSGRELANGVAHTATELGTHGYAKAATDLIDSFDRAQQPRVMIRVLGDFTVIHNGSEVRAGTWQSRKARDLLKILIARRGRPIARMALMEYLWPGKDPGRLTNRLSVALSTVRGVLDPAKEFGPTHLVPADGESIRLDITRVAIDVEGFLADATAGLARRRAGPSPESTQLLTRAEAAYVGDFLEDSPYEDWAIPLREEAKAAYLQVVRALADDAANAGDYGAVARYQLRILEHDPYDERAHLDLVRALDAAGSHGEARRRYRAYTERMAEIDVEAAPFPTARG